MYYVAGSSSSYESSDHGYVSANPRDQKACRTCVAQAVTAAVEMSLANTMHISMSHLENSNLTASPLALYYCARGGRTCDTGWDIPQALKDMVRSTMVYFCMLMQVRLA